MSPLFIIITPTHKRPAELARAIQSVREQEYTSFVHIVINDSPEYDYTTIEKELLKDEKIIYFKNKKNIGKNASLNNALCYIHDNKLAGYILFLDDDDWLNDNALQSIADVLNNNKIKWLVTERVLADNIENRKQKNTLTKYNYFFDYLLGKRIFGDKTHSISTDLLFSKNRPSFSKSVKNGEEWFFFCQVSSYFFHTPLPSTLTHGYAIDGLNIGMQKTYLQNTWKLWGELKNMKIVFYLFLRTFKITLSLIGIYPKKVQ